MARVAKSLSGKRRGRVKRGASGPGLKVIANPRVKTRPKGAKKPKIGPDEKEARVYLKRTEYDMAAEIAKSLDMSFSEYARSLIVYGGVSNINRTQDWVPAPREVSEDEKPPEG